MWSQLILFSPLFTELASLLILKVAGIPLTQSLCVCCFSQLECSSPLTCRTYSLFPQIFAQMSSPLFFALLYYQYLEQCLAHSKCSVDICWANELTRVFWNIKGYVVATFNHLKDFLGEEGIHSFVQRCLWLWVLIYKEVSSQSFTKTHFPTGNWAVLWVSTVVIGSTQQGQEYVERVHSFNMVCYVPGTMLCTEDTEMNSAQRTPVLWDS